jgi:hypothetical protein
LETVYPWQLANEMAAAVARQLNIKQPTVQHLTQSTAASAGRQLRGHRAPRLIPEYKLLVPLKTKPGDPPWQKGEAEINGQLVRSHGLPEGSRFLQQVEQGGEVRLVAGIAWSKQEFLAAAAMAMHPIDTQGVADSDYAVAVFEALTKGKNWVEAKRRERINELKKFIVKAKANEEHIHERMCKEQEAVMKSKHFLAFKFLLEKVGHEDAHLLKHFMTGFPITGVLEPTGVFEACENSNPERRDASSLLRGSKRTKAAISHFCKPSGDPDMDDLVWQATMAEVQAGWAVGPFSQAQLDEALGPFWIPAPRFGLRQGSKTRMIDDFSIMGHNSTLSSTERIRLGGIDEIVAMIKTVAASSSPDGSVHVRAGADCSLEGAVHESWLGGGASTLHGTTVDLKAAYKQVVRRRADEHFAVVAVWDPVHQKIAYFKAISLPFGSTGSVTGFNRCAVALRKILVKHFLIPCTSYYDDFPVVGFANMTQQAVEDMVEVLDLLGWEVARDKLKAPAASFDALGVTFSLGNLANKKAMSISNTSSRIHNIVAEIDHFIEVKRMRPSEAASLRGRLVFAEAQHFGRCGSLLTRQLAARALGVGPSDHIGPELESALLMLRWLVVAAPPRSVDPWNHDPPVVIFTDGAAEGEGSQRGSVGGVLMEPGCRLRFFSADVPHWLMGEWAGSGSKQVIFQVEILPIILAKRIWRGRLKGRRNLFFLDNEAARFAILAAYTPVARAQALLLLSAAEDGLLQAMTWYARVPTVANIADGPSRGSFGEMAAMGAIRDEVAMLSREELQPAYFIKRMSSLSGSGAAKKRSGK